MSKYHSNLNLTVEINLSKFLDTKIHLDNNEIKCFAYCKEMKLPFHWASAVPKHYKKNIIIGDLHRVNLRTESYKNNPKNNLLHVEVAQMSMNPSLETGKIYKI